MGPWRTILDGLQAARHHVARLPSCCRSSRWQVAHSNQLTNAPRRTSRCAMLDDRQFIKVVHAVHAANASWVDGLRRAICCYLLSVHGISGFSVPIQDACHSAPSWRRSPYPTSRCAQVCHSQHQLPQGQSMLFYAKWGRPTPRSGAPYACR